MGSARVALASGAAAIAGAGVLLAGRFDGSALLVLALLAGARAGALAASTSEPGAVRALGRAATATPAWIAVVAVATLRSGSSMLDDVRGANAVAGLPLARGDATMVAAAWLAIAAGAIAISAAVARGGAYRGLSAAAFPASRLDGLASVGYVVLLVTLFAGPQMVAAADALVWAGGVAAVSVAALAARPLARWDRADALALAVGAVAFALALFGRAP